MDISQTKVRYPDSVTNGAGAGSGLRARKTERTRLELIDAAVKLCLSEGYENTTVEQIAAAADVSPRTFSRYFTTKDAVFLAVLDGVADDIAAQVSVQPDDLGPLEALRAAHVAAFTQIANRPYGNPSADQVAMILRVINSSDTLQKKAIEYRNQRAIAILAERAGVPVDDRNLQFATTLFNVTLVTACAHLVADTEVSLLGPRMMVERIEQAFGQLAELAADLPPAPPAASASR
jgi:AcrR family transcriptional regulator